jgi:uncharacterized protein YyaL (SSP411 family)
MSNPESNQAKNRLGGETSPYLLQHADNPVNWYPWGEAALLAARDSNKPILLSIGYSACHWCHVMAHESFEDSATAEVMNELFINIKVDREERPDIDRIYQTAHQLLTQRPGGWPLTMFINPEDQKPFFGGTYFPGEARYGLPAFTDLLRRVAEYFEQSSADIAAQAKQLGEILQKLEPAALAQDDTLNATPLAAARAQLAKTFDKHFGGFGGAPKFPHPQNIDRLLRHWREGALGDEPDVEALYMATLTLTRMAEGGIYDQLEGGFCRYSVDAQWQIPHFEKMLYDNGPLLALYAQAFLASGDEFFGRIANQTADWIMHRMGAPGGGFYSSLDADSEGEEGRYYVWDPEDVRQCIGENRYPLVAQRFGLEQAPNFEGKWHLVIKTSIQELAASRGGDPALLITQIDEARALLLAERKKRIEPGLDDKQLTSWNALAIRGLAIAGRATRRPELVAAALEGARFLNRELFRDGRLYATHKNGESRFQGYLDDHAFLLDAILEVLQSSWDSELLKTAIELAELLLNHFEDRQSGGFYFTADDHEQLMHRPKPLADEAMPSGNGIAAFSLQRLGFMLGESRYLEAAEKCLRASWQAMSEYPQGHVSLLTALEEYLSPPEIIVIRGPTHEIARWQQAAAAIYSPRRLVLGIDETEEDLPGALAERHPVDGSSVAYRCQGTTCSLPITTWEALAEQMSDDHDTV